MQQIEIICQPQQMTCRAQPEQALRFAYPFVLEAVIKITNQGQESCLVSLQLLDQQPSQLWSHVAMQISRDQEIVFSNTIQAILAKTMPLSEVAAASAQQYLVQFSLEPSLFSLQERIVPFTLHFAWKWQLVCGESHQTPTETPVSPQVLAVTSGLLVDSNAGGSNSPGRGGFGVLVGPLLLLLPLLVFVIMRFIHVVKSKKKTHSLGKN